MLAARCDRLNQIAVDTATPYIDIATGIDTTTSPPVAGGRVAKIVPGGPCLHCLGELDAGEITRWVKDPDQQTLDRQHGYGATVPAPSVVHLNGITVYAAIGELVAWISGHRPPAQYIDIDLSAGLTRIDADPGTRVSPRQPRDASPHCISCHATTVTRPLAGPTARPQAPSASTKEDRASPQSSAVGPVAR